MTENDYYEASKVEFDMAIKSEAFGFNSTLSTEVISCEYLNKDNNDVKNQGNMKMDFQSHFSDDSAHNAATTFEYTKKFTHWMFDNNLFIKDGIIYDNIDGCIKQY